MSYLGQVSKMVSFDAHGGAKGQAYYAEPATGARVGGVVLIHHMPGWDDWTQEAARKLAHHGFACIAPHLYFRELPGSPDDCAARARAPPARTCSVSRMLLWYTGRLASST